MTYNKCIHMQNFLKDLCIVKRKLNVKKKAFLIEQVSVLILSETPQKFGDPGSPNISIMIGESCIGRVLLDLRGSVNLLPFSVYEQLGLGELKNTSIMLQLADRSVKELRGIVEDVLVQVDKFYYPVNFVVLDMQQPNSTIYQAPVILGRPFLTISNALINCRSGVLKLTFGKMVLELNVFNTCKMPAHFDDTDSSLPLEVQFAGLRWKPQFETLTPPDILKSSEKEVSQLELKLLPQDLKYVFFGPEESTFPVVISSKLNQKDEAQLIKVLKKYRGAIGWTIANIKGIDAVVCTHRIHLEDDARPVCDAQRRLNPTIKEVAKEEVPKLLAVGIIYPISNISGLRKL
ncbi:uncharacterized protein LOC109011670 isoform X2 [Juglans regia]|uniref:Uncharacterized protein LOC109011670 isoform X2 n=1 Tax=Juglans regia TaxID=51240 RepID=A0A6P9ECH1_JUGRE|nr:uncharacterized protein LOC109011670 isoform X2 [Juglans regia]